MWAFINPAKGEEIEKRLLCFLKEALQCAQFLHTFRYPPGSFTSKTKTHADPYRINVRLQDRSGETRTRGLLLPKQARYQLRNTPERYYTSISRFGAFVNAERAKIQQKARPGRCTGQRLRAGQMCGDKSEGEMITGRSNALRCRSRCP